MQRLIDADALLMDNSWAFYDENGNRNDACIAVENAPTVEAEPVVRCKDCRWYENDGFHTNCKIMQFCVESEDYCSRGERREDAETD